MFPGAYVDIVTHSLIWSKLACGTFVDETSILADLNFMTEAAAKYVELTVVFIL